MDHTCDSYGCPHWNSDQKCINCKNLYLRGSDSSGGKLCPGCNGTFDLSELEKVKYIQQTIRKLKGYSHMEWCCDGCKIEQLKISLKPIKA
jgi:hypothetical protein